jgi:hypothetical protein
VPNDKKTSIKELRWGGAAQGRGPVIDARLYLEKVGEGKNTNNLKGKKRIGEET